MKRPTNGYSILEMLVAVSLMAVVMTLFGRVMVTSVVIQGDVHDAAWSQDRVSEVLRAIREDVWSAEKLTVASEDAVTIALGDRQAVRWSVESAEGSGDETPRWQLRRVADGEARVFALPPLTARPQWQSRGRDALGLALEDACWWFASERIRLNPHDEGNR
ncbi:MAG: prepilin-type N-terminal cleavage/methylation domain-containing protein [Planctomycetota bacterium]